MERTKVPKIHRNKPPWKTASASSYSSLSLQDLFWNLNAFYNSILSSTGFFSHDFFVPFSGIYTHKSLQSFCKPFFSPFSLFGKTKKEERIWEEEDRKKTFGTYIAAVASHQYSSIAHPCWRLRRWSRLGAKNRVGAEQSQTALLLLLLLLLLLPLLLLLLPRFHEFSAPREETQLILSTTFTITLSASATSSFFFVRWRSIQHRSLHSGMQKYLEHII